MCVGVNVKYLLPESNFMKILSVGAKLFHEDRQAGRHKASSRFTQFCKGTILKLECLYYDYITEQLNQVFAFGNMGNEEKRK
jgi:hypothetical protein